MPSLFRVLLITGWISSSVLAATDPTENKVAGPVQSELGANLVFPAGSVEILPQQFEYQIKNDGTIVLGNVVVSPGSIGVDFEFKPGVPPTNKIIFKWPRALMWNGVIDVKSDDKVVFKVQVTNPDVYPIPESTTFTYSMNAEEVELLSQTKNLQYCMHNSNDDNLPKNGETADAKPAPAPPKQKASFCSAPFKLTHGANGFSARPKKLNNLQYAIGDNKKIKNKGFLPLKPKGFTPFEAFLRNGSNFKLEVGIVPIELDDVVFESDFIYLQGKGTIPYSPEVQGTPDFWRARFNVDQPVLYFRTPGNFVMRQDFRFKRKLPDESLALNFSLPRNGVQVMMQRFEYEVLKNGNLLIGDVEFNADSIEMKLEANTENPPRYKAKFVWPTQFIIHGMLEIRGDEKSIVSFEVPEEDDRPGTPMMAIEKTLDMRDVDQMAASKDITFCLRSFAGEPKSAFCSKPYRIKKEKGISVLAQTKEERISFVTYNNKRGKTKGSILIENGRPTPFEVFTRSGAYFMFDIAPVHLLLDDVVYTDGKVYLKGRGNQPTGNNVEVNKDRWRVGVDFKNPSMYFWTDNRFVIRQDLKFTKKLPTETQRMYLMKQSRHTTYIAHVPLHVNLQPFRDSQRYKVETDEWSTYRNKQQNLDWDFKAEELEKINRSHLNITDSTGRYALYYDIYRGHQFEGIFKLGALHADPSNALLAHTEIGGTAWLEQFWQSEDPTWSLQKWGVSASYLHYLSVYNYASQDNLQIISTELNYRVTPGIKDRDMGWGGSLAFQFLNQSGSAASLFGVGGFYFGRFPKALDKLINKLVVFTWPKWVELKAAYFLTPLTSNATLGSNYMISALTKVFFTDQFFGTVGLEVRKYDVTIFGADQYGAFVTDQIQPNIMALVFGAGMNF